MVSLNQALLAAKREQLNPLNYFPHYQPIVYLPSGEIAGYEALARRTNSVGEASSAGELFANHQYSLSNRRQVDRYVRQQALEQFGDDAPLLIAVTVLTSMDAAELTRLGVDKTPEEQVIYLANLAKESGLDGVVCSAQEAKKLEAELGADFKLVTPGIRPAGSDAGDQKRIMTPKQAVEDGSDYLVVGRPITQSADPVATLKEINDSLK